LFHAVAEAKVEGGVFWGVLRVVVDVDVFVGGFYEKEIPCAENYVVEKHECEWGKGVLEQQSQQKNSEKKHKKNQNRANKKMYMKPIAKPSGVQIASAVEG
jgi:hypothetical protein